MIEDFFQLPQVSTKPVVRIKLRIPTQIFEKIQNGPTQGLGGNWFMKKTRRRNIVTLSLSVA
jgi:hypothetical protein